MIYYKDPMTGSVYAYASKALRDEYGQPGLVEMDATEVEAHLKAPTGPLQITSEFIDAERDRRANAGITFKGVLYQTGPDDRDNISGAALLATMAIMAGAQRGNLRWHDQDSDFVWIAADNSKVPMDAYDVVELGKLAATRKQALIYAGRNLKDMEEIPADFTDDKWWPA